MSTTKSIKISYTLNPPSVISSKLEKELPQKSKSHEYVIGNPSSGINQDKPTKHDEGYYIELRKMLQHARLEVGDELTTWKELVGKEEVSKEAKKGKTAASTEDEEGEDEDEDQS